MEWRTGDSAGRANGAVVKDEVPVAAVATNAGGWSGAIVWGCWG